MDKKIEKQIFFGILILVIILFSLSQIVPWSTLDYEDKTIGTYYSWGYNNRLVNLENKNATKLYILGIFDTYHNLGKTSEEKKEENDNLFIYSIGYNVQNIAWILALCTIIFSLISFLYLIKFKYEKMKLSIFCTSFFSIMVFILFYLSINFLIVEPTKYFVRITKEMYYDITKFNLHFSTGFYLFIVGLIIITGLEVYIVSKKFSKSIVQ